MDLKSSDQVERDTKNGPSVLYFFADWAAPCQQMNEVVSVLAEDFSNINFFRIEAEALPDVSEKFGIESVPSFAFVSDGKNVGEVLKGADVSALNSRVDALSKVSSNSGQSDLNSRLKLLVNQEPVMLFMKGNPQEPRCGFSRRMVDLLNSEGVTFGHFDILGDEDVRQGLKTFSNWPTYPQLYANGELLGGIDVVKEMVEDGELKDALGSRFVP